MLHPENEEDLSWALNLLKERKYSQPALFAFQVSLGCYWLANGQAPEAMLGHGIGEIACMCVGGALDLQDGLELVCSFSLLMQQLEEAKIEEVTVNAHCSEVEAAIKHLGLSQAYIVAVNGPEDVVISGSKEDVLCLVAELSKCIISPTLSAPFVGEICLLDEFSPTLISKLQRIGMYMKLPSIPIISTSTGKYCDESICSQDYWLQYITHPVLFFDAVSFVISEGMHTFVEMGPLEVLTSKTAGWANDLSRTGHGLKLRWFSGTDCSADEMNAVFVSAAKAEPAFEMLQFRPENHLHRLLQTVTKELVTNATMYCSWLHEDLVTSWLGDCLFEGKLSLLPSTLLEITAAAIFKNFSSTEFVSFKNMTFKKIPSPLSADQINTAALIVKVLPLGKLKISLLNDGDKQSVAWGMSSQLSREEEKQNWIGYEQQYISMMEFIKHEIESTYPIPYNYGEAGIFYGDSYRVIKTLQCIPESNSVIAVAQLRIQDFVFSKEEGRGYLVHPTLLEGLVQTVSAAALMCHEPGTGFKLPCNLVSIKTAALKVSAHAPMDRYHKELTVLVKVWINEGLAEADAFLADANGVLVLAWSGLKLQPVT